MSMPIENTHDNNIDRENQKSEEKPVTYRTKTSSAIKLSKNILFATAIVIIIGIIQTIILTQKQQDTRSRASILITPTPTFGKIINHPVNDHKALLVPPPDLSEFEDRKTESTLGSEAPSVKILKPSNGFVFPQYTAQNINVSAQHISGIKEIRIYIGNTFLRACAKTTSCNFWSNINIVPAGTYTLKATAQADDATANIGEASIQVSKAGGATSTPTKSITSNPTNSLTATPTKTPTPTIQYAPPSAIYTPTKIPASTPTSTTALYPKIIGSATYQNAAKEALDLIKNRAPEDLDPVTKYINEIRESNQNWYWGGNRYIEVASSSMTHSPAWAAGTIVHEATHAKNWFTNNLPVFGCEGEAKSLRAQADFLRKIGEESLARYVESFIEKWC